MSQVTASIDVEADPTTAFKVFTEEIDCWWIQGPINFHDATRAYGKKIEPGVGGRIIEVYDREAGDGLELARITVWAPPARLAWQSSLDDVHIDVTFGPSTIGTHIDVLATIPDGGVDRGGTAWVRTTPVWLPRWFARRAAAANTPERMARLAVAVRYTKPATAARWLRDVFGLDPVDTIPDDDVVGEETWIEFHVGNASVIIIGRDSSPAEGAPATHTPWVFVDDLDAHRSRAKAGGATAGDIWHHGARAYEATDLEGNQWTFAQASPLMRSL